MKLRLLKKTVLLTAAVLCLMLCACGSVAQEEPTDAVIAEEPTPEPTVEPTPEPVSVVILGKTYAESDTAVDLSAMTDEDTASVCEALSQLPSVKEINLIGEDTYTSVSTENLGLIQEAAPKATLKCAFDVYGEYVTDETLEIRFTYKQLGDECIDFFRSIMPYLKSLELLRLEECGIKDYDAMEQLKNDFPDKNIVWNIIMGSYSYMTDTTLVNTTLLNDDNKYLTKYLHDVLYLDIGHDAKLSDIEFVRNFPKLQAAIISITLIDDLSPFEDCPDLEFLECFSTKISDLTPLKGLKKLKYLNIGDCENIDDITPLYWMNSLEKVRICGRTRNNVTEEEIRALIDRLPDTSSVSWVGGHSAKSGGWRYFEQRGENPYYIVPRYKLLREQMQYEIGFLEKRASNSPSKEVKGG